jgi:oxygen-dependent protoporphyrinogen oxidase
MALDLVLPRSEECKDDESLAAFVIRRLGHEALERLAEPLICSIYGSIYGSNPNHLSARATAGSLVKMEADDGSLIRGLWRQSQLSKRCQQTATETAQAGPQYSQMASLDEGLSVLIDSLLNKLPPGALVTGKSVERIHDGINGRRWDVVLTDGSVLTADGLILAMPAKYAAQILREMSRTLADKLRSITYRSETIVNLLYKRNQIAHCINGYGFVVPRAQRRIVRACTFSSIKFANRAADGEVLVRVSTEHSQATDSQIEQMISDELDSYLGLHADPVYSLISRHSTAIPQYAVGHNDLVNEIQWALRRIPGLALAGNAYGGVDIPDCIRSGKDAAQSILSDLCA